MDKIINGILKFRSLKRPNVLHRLDTFKKPNTPDAVFISCMDARVYPTHFTASEIGDLYMVRNAGNFVPNAKKFENKSAPISTEPGALELACCRGNVNKIVICGHSDCKAMDLLLKLGKHNNLDREEKLSSPLERWVAQHGKNVLKTFVETDPLCIMLDFGTNFPKIEVKIDAEQRLSPADRLSQLNVLQQMTNVYSHPILLDKISLGKLRVLGMWYKISTADVYLFSRFQKRFVIVDESSSSRLMEEYS